ncbi:MAG: FMN-binding glutamate synthase family protein [Rhodomicrobium sp.]|nr:MAG: FMN-binding glutamate synthase family protein [Rhodomicrobium sp.]
MSMNIFFQYAMAGMVYLSAFFIFLLGLIAIYGILLFFIDKTQTRDSIRYNYPVIGRFRYIFSELGEFFRQYFFAMDREEMPFNRAERDWVYKSSRGVDNTVAFGSTKNLNVAGTVIFNNSAFPLLDSEAQEPAYITFGEGCETPYVTNSVINISGMSFGALSGPAVKALSKGAELAGCWMNTGEGGLSPYHMHGNADIVFQIGTAKYGVRNAEGHLDQDKLRELGTFPFVKMFEIKLSQGAKPGKGGILPGAKVTAEIARIRGISEGEPSISFNRHPEIDNVQSLLDFIDLVRGLVKKPVGIKMVIGGTDWFDDFAKEIHKRGIASAPDFITVDSGDGGTGAAPMPLIDNVGLPIRQALPLLVDKLNEFGLRERIKVNASGKLITPAEVAWAYCAGADTVSTARGFMFALGCIQALKCNKNTCPTGITTHNRRLQRGLDPSDKAVRVANFANKIQYGSGLIAHSCGVTQVRDLRRNHCRVVQDTGVAVCFNELYPDAEMTYKLAAL